MNHTMVNDHGQRAGPLANAKGISLEERFLPEFHAEGKNRYGWQTEAKGAAVLFLRFFSGLPQFSSPS